MPTVLIAYKSLPHYRLAFFEQLRDSLQTRGIKLRLMYGDAIGQDAKKKDTAVLPWAEYRKSVVLPVARSHIVYQPVLRDAQGADLVIVEQASKLLVNYALLVMQQFGRTKVAFWGHGRNFQASSGSSVAESIKRAVSTRPNWWFAYNQMSARVLEDLGYPSDRITVVQNAIDTSTLRHDVDGVADEELTAARATIGVKGDSIGLFIGGMYEQKRLRFLIDASRKVREALPDFELVIAGAGESQAIAEEAAKNEPWVHYVGPAFGKQKALLLKMSKAIVMPGLVGLVVLDSFAAATPMITTAVPFHSPEIEYLLPEVNGVVVTESESATAYASAVLRVLTDADLRHRLANGCRAAADIYTVEAMVANFVSGIEDALAA